MSTSTTFNPIISGISVSGDLDTSAQPLMIQFGNSDRIGYVRFALQNSGGSYTTRTRSGNATCQIDVIPLGGTATTIFRGTVELLEPEISTQRGSIAVVHAYDYGQELLGIISPDARQKSPINFSDGTTSIISGDQGIESADGMDLVAWISGVNLASGATVAQLMRQYFGNSGDNSGSYSGAMKSFKPHISGYTWRTFYYPDNVNGTYASDNNLNYWLPQDIFRVRREFGWNALRRMTRQALPIDRNGNRTQFEIYIGVSGDIHIFTSGSYEFIASGVTLQYYDAGASGSHLNNLIEAKIPFDTTQVKNSIIGWFPPLTQFPTDQDAYTDLGFYSGLHWSGIRSNNITSALISGTSGASRLGNISITGIYSTTNANLASVGATLRLDLSGSPLNLSKYNVVGGQGLRLNYMMRFSGTIGPYPFKHVGIFDNTGKFICKSGFASNVGPNSIPQPNSSNANSALWQQYSETIFGADGAFNSGTGLDGGWASATAAQADFPDLTNVVAIEIGVDYTPRNLLGSTTLIPGAFYQSIDNLYFSMAFPFSPVWVFNSGSIGMGYGRRYEIVEFPEEVSDIAASGLVTHELNSKMGPKGVAEFLIKDNPVNPISAQLNIKPGQAFIVDAPTLNTGSGQYFFYWRAIDVTHEWSHRGGFFTKVRAVPWFSGTLVDPASNLISYELPPRYQAAKPQPRGFDLWPYRFPLHRPH